MANKDEKLHKVIVESKMNIQVGCWCITADSLNYILSRKSGRRMITDGYYSTLEELLDDLLEKRLKESESASIEALRKEIKTTKKELKKLCKELNSVKER